jgi:hypothetical protein
MEQSISNKGLNLFKITSVTVRMVGVESRPSMRLPPSPGGLSFMPDRWTDQGLTLEPFDQFGFEYAGGGKRRNPPQRQAVVFCQALNRVLTQAKKFCDFCQLHPSIRTTYHAQISSFHIVYPGLSAIFEITQSRPEEDIQRCSLGPVLVA